MSETSPDPLAAKYAAEFRENGCLLVSGLVSAEEIEELRRETACVCRGDYEIPGITPAPEDADENAVLAAYLCVHQPHKVSDVLRKYVAHPGIVGVLTQLIGPNVKSMQSMLFIKPPGFPGQAYHQDERYIPTEDRSLTGAWIALDDATIENGCLWVIPGSHKGALYPWAPHANPEYDFADAAQGVPMEQEIPIRCHAGDVVFFNGYLLHSSRKNRSETFRRALVNHYMSAESDLKWQGHEDYRDVVLVAGVDPHEARGYADLSRPSLRPATGSAS